MRGACFLRGSGRSDATALTELRAISASHGIRFESVPAFMSNPSGLAPAGDRPFLPEGIETVPLYFAIEQINDRTPRTAARLCSGSRRERLEIQYARDPKREERDRHWDSDACESCGPPSRSLFFLCLIQNSALLRRAFLDWRIRIPGGSFAKSFPRRWH